MNIQGNANSLRIYALDALRAIMMLLGIILHAGLTYSSMDYGKFWPIKDRENSILFDLIVALIHFFRMPVFFVVSGYFGALLFYKKGPYQMLINRMRRILLPFIAGVLIVYPIALFSFEYTKSSIAGAVSPVNDALRFIASGKFLPFNVLHLWFLYFLAFFAAGGCLIAQLFNTDTRFTISGRKVISFVLQNIWLRHLTMAIFFFLCLYWIGETSLTTNNDWSIDPSIFITYFLFFEIGWVIYKTNSLDDLKKYSVLQLLIGMLLFFAFIITPWPEAAWSLHAKQLLSSLFVSLFIFGFIALSMRYFNIYSQRLNYIMGAAYWVYIIHLPVVAFVPGLIAETNLPAFFKFLIVLAITTLISMISYHYGVRNTFVGKFLNGKTRNEANSKDVQHEK
jgi:glucans biosynthesis protein C